MSTLDAAFKLIGWIGPWGWGAVACLALGASIKYVSVVGWKGALASLLAIITLGALSVSYRKGKEDREKEGAANVKKVLKQAQDARADVRNELDAHPERLRDDDGYRRKD